MKFADYLAVQNLIFRYCDHLDRGDFTAMAKLFAHADVYLGAAEQPLRSDPQAMAAMYRDFVRIHPDGTPRTRHLTTNLIIEEDGPGQIRAQSYITVVQSTESMSLQPIIGGRNLDRFGLVDGRWQFVERRIENDMWGDLSAHLQKAFGPGSSGAGRG